MNAYSQPATILCVDDNDAARYTLARALRRGGYQVIEGRSGADAIKLASELPDLITLDVRLPDIDGFEVCQRLKSVPKTAQIPVLHISATCVEPEHRVRGLRGGADGFLNRPVNDEELLATVNALLRLKRAEQEAQSRAEEAERAKNEVAALNETLRGTIRELEQAQAKLTEREARLRMAQRAAHSGTWECNLETGALIWSPEQETVYGLRGGDVPGDLTSWKRLVLGEDLKIAEDALRRAIAEHTEYHVEFRINRPDGAERCIESFGEISYRENGTAYRIVGVDSDITGRKDIEDALRKSEFRFRRLVDSNIIPVVCADINGITEANDAFLDMVGYTRDDLAQGIDWVQMTPQEHAAKDHIALEELRSKGFCTPFEKEYVRRDGSRVPFLVGGTVLSASPLKWLCFFVELTSLKQAEAKLREAHEKLEIKVVERTQQLATTITSLQSEMQVRRTAEQQLRELSARLLRLQDEERRRIARDLHDSTGQTLTAMKLTLSAVEKAVKPSQKAASLFRDLNTLADQALQEIRTISHLLHPPLLDEVGFSSAAQWYVEGFSKRSGVRANLQISAAISLSKEAEAVLFRVLQESLTNVLRHSGSEAVDIDFSTNAKDAFLCIRDYGKGIPADKLTSFRETGAGVGIGLGGMKQRVRELNGQLTVESTGGGTSVTATLPLAKCIPAA